MARDDHAGVDERAPVAVRTATLDERDTMPFARTVVGDAEADDSATDDEDMLAHARWLMPQHSGSASSKISVASSVM